MNSIKDSFKNFSEPLKAIAKNTKRAWSGLSTKKDKKGTVDIFDYIIEVHPRIFWMPFPAPENIEIIADFLNTNFADNYFIWNVSEHSYDIHHFRDQVSEQISVGYPCPTLNQIFLICKSIVSWLANDKRNVVVVHCQESRGRSSLIISCLLCIIGRFSHPVDALSYFCSQIKSQENKVLFPSHHLYLRYFSHILDGIRVRGNQADRGVVTFFLNKKMNEKPVVIKKIIFSEIPGLSASSSPASLQDEDDDEAFFKPYLQIFKESKILFNSLSNQKVPKYKSTDLSFWFDLDISVTEDILIRCKHFVTNDERVPILRLMLHTGFIFDNVVRFFKRDIDFSSKVAVTDNFFIDIFFEEVNVAEKKGTTKSSLQSDYDYILNECKKIKDVKGEENVLDAIRRRERGEPSKHDEKHEPVVVPSEDKESKKPPVTAAKDSAGSTNEDNAKKEKLSNPQGSKQTNPGQAATSFEAVAGKPEASSKSAAHIKPVNNLLNILDEDHTLNEQELDEYIN